MKIQDFISQNIGLKPDKEHWCSSVVQYQDGNFYSYGKHYPLLFKVKKIWFVNEREYSNSTSKHTCWAKRALPYNSIEMNQNNRRWYNDVHTVKLPHCDSYTGENPSFNVKTVRKALKLEKKELEIICKKGRAGTFAMSNRLKRIAEINNSLKALN